MQLSFSFSSTSGPRLPRLCFVLLSTAGQLHVGAGISLIRKNIGNLRILFVTSKGERLLSRRLREGRARSVTSAEDRFLCRALNKSYRDRYGAVCVTFATVPVQRPKRLGTSAPCLAFIARAGFQ